jgi:hypothetical protein
MKILHAVVVAALSLSLTGCVVSEQKFVQYRTITKKRPDLQAKFMSVCIKEEKRLSQDTRELVAAMIDVRTANMPQVICRRILRSFLNGNMTYQDYRNIMAVKPTPRIIRLMRGQ